VNENHKWVFEETHKSEARKKDKEHMGREMVAQKVRKQEINGCRYEEGNGG
jgi:hypothetical protein